jgi:hypothetical protein
VRVTNQLTDSNSRNGKEVRAGTQSDAFDWKLFPQPNTNTKEGLKNMSKKILVLLATLALVIAVGCAKSETTTETVGTETVTDTSMTSGTTDITTDTTMTMSTDTMATDTMSTDTSGTMTTGTDTVGTSGTSTTSTTSGTVSTTTT